MGSLDAPRKYEFDEYSFQLSIKVYSKEGRMAPNSFSIAARNAKSERNCARKTEKSVMDVHSEREYIAVLNWTDELREYKSRNKTQNNVFKSLIVANSSYPICKNVPFERGLRSSFLEPFFLFDTNSLLFPNLTKVKEGMVEWTKEFNSLLSTVSKILSKDISFFDDNFTATQLSVFTMFLVGLWIEMMRWSKFIKL